MAAVLTRRWLAASGAVVAACVVAASVWIWTSSDESPQVLPEDAVRLTTPERLNGGDPHHTVNSPEEYLPEAVRIRLWGMTGTTRIADDSTLTVLFTLDQLGGPGDEWGEFDQSNEHVVEGLSEGDTVDAGAVSIEVVHIWDSDDDDEDAADVRVTFERAELGQPLPEDDDITVR